uniref:Uncharacterized protein n=1 Tax=Mola mola TaxID=94237 RepID=A0A3Q3VP18_MOLML
RHRENMQTPHRNVLTWNRNPGPSCCEQVENYRSAWTRMAEDIILPIDLSWHQDLGRCQLDDTDIDVMTKAEIMARETNKAASQRDRIQDLQNELIKGFFSIKNDSEKELLNLQRYQRCHQSRTTKMATLEATAREQDKIIDKMERALVTKLREKIHRVVTKQRERLFMLLEETELALTAENTRLRQELDRIGQHLDALPVKEKLSLLDKKRGGLEENSKSWGRQKQEMLTKLS